jgi:putative Mg2+ transporter-C (MgtC) family protein
MLVDIFPFNWWAILSCICNGALIGLERQLRGKPVGIRTSILIVSGTYYFMALGLYMSESGSDQARILAQIISGIGFLGAGVMMTQDGKIHGVTSAAVIWVLAAIGMMIGLDFARQSLLITAITLATLWGIDRLENSYIFLRKGVHQHFENRRARYLSKTIIKK